MVLPNRPAAHDVQLPAPARLYKPAAHAMHGTAPPALYCPAAHVEQFAWDGSELKLPAAHGVHDDVGDVVY